MSGSMIRRRRRRVRRDSLPIERTLIQVAICLLLRRAGHHHLWICNKKNPIAIDDASNFGEDHNFGEDRSTKLGFRPTNPNIGYTVLESWSLCFFEIPDRLRSLGVENSSSPDSDHSVTAGGRIVSSQTCLIRASGCALGFSQGLFSQGT